jgi:hypothetical protein
MAARHDSYIPDSGRSAANGPLSPGFVCSTPDSRPSPERVGKTGVDPKLSFSLAAVVGQEPLVALSR